VEVHPVANPLALLPGWKPAFVGSELAGALPEGIKSFHVLAAGKDYRLAGVGTVDARGPAASLGGNVVVMAIDQAAQLLGQPDLVTQIVVTLEPGTDREQVRRRLQEVVADKGEVHTPEANDQAVRDIMGGLELSFSLGGVMALVVGLFLVYNALSVSVAERRPEIGMLRSLGATRLQIARLFAGEALLLGLIGSGLGLPLGTLLSFVGLGPIEQVLSDVFVPLSARPTAPTPATLSIAIAAGVLVSLLATLVPATQAALQEPADVVRRRVLRPGLIYRLLQAGSCILLVVAGLACMVFREALPSRVGTFACASLILLGALAATPIWAAAMARVLQPLARFVLGVEGRLAADNLARSSARTGLVIAAVAAVVALMFQTAGVIVSSEESILGWIDHSIAADLFITANGPVTSGGASLPMEADLGKQMAELPGIEGVIPIRFQHVEFQNKIIFLIAFDVANISPIPPDRIPPDRRVLYERLREPNTVIVSENFAVLHGIGPGHRLTIRGPYGPLELQVLGTIVDYSWNRGTIMLDRALYQEHFRDKLIDVFDVYVRPGTDVETVRTTLAHRWGAEHALVALTRQELRENISTTIRRLYGLLYVQEAVVGLVAMLGVVTALLISVIQRRRELGLLRAVGASRAQVLRSVLAEATLMGLIGSLIGILVGIPLEWYAVRIIFLDEAGFVFPVRISWSAAGVLAGSTLAIATLAGLMPALRAIRLCIPEAIAYE
jgi:putative ABC transport system permease protein